MRVCYTNPTDNSTSVGFRNRGKKRQVLRDHSNVAPRKKTIRAIQIAETLEVSSRTIYRDIAALQARQVPILGEAGIGYVMRAGYDFPPLNLDADEAEAVALGLEMIARLGDVDLLKAARRASRKLSAIAPGTRQLIASRWGAPYDTAAPLVRRAIAAEQMLEIV